MAMAQLMTFTRVVPRQLALSALALGFGAASVLVCGSTRLLSADINTWTSIGPDGGPVRALAVDPVNPTIVYAGTAGGGIFKSTDGGGHWRAASIVGHSLHSSMLML